MLTKTILIPLAAFAVTVTGASAFNSDMLKRAGLNDDQIAAFEEAKELKEAGEKEKARDVLIAAGVDEEVIRQVREAMRESFDATREAIEANDYAAFRIAAEGSPMLEIIDTEAEFARLVEAHALLRSGNKAGAKDIFDELGFPAHGFVKPFGDRKEPPFMSRLSDGQKAEIRTAMESRNHGRVTEILAEAGIDLKSGHKERGRGFRFGGKDRAFVE